MHAHTQYTHSHNMSTGKWSPANPRTPEPDPKMYLIVFNTDIYTLSVYRILIGNLFDIFSEFYERNPKVLWNNFFFVILVLFLLKLFSSPEHGNDVR